MHIDTEDDIDSFVQKVNVPPFLDLAASEQMFVWSHKKFWSGQIFFHNDSDAAALRRKLSYIYGPPTFENSSLRITKWKWSTPRRKVAIQLDTDNQGVTSLLLTQED